MMTRDGRRALYMHPVILMIIGLIIIWTQALLHLYLTMLITWASRDKETIGKISLPILKIKIKHIIQIFVEEVKVI